MAVDQEKSTRRQTRVHRKGVACVELDQDEALPTGAVRMAIRLNAVEEGLLELEDVLHVHTDHEGLACSNRGVSHNDVFELVCAGGKDRGPLVDLGGIEEIEDGKVLNLENLVHAFKAEAAFSVEEVRDMSLLESGLLGEAEPGEFACFDAVPKNFTEVFLQDFELHGRSIASGLWRGIKS